MLLRRKVFLLFLYFNSTTARKTNTAGKSLKLCCHQVRKPQFRAAGPGPGTQSFPRLVQHGSLMPLDSFQDLPQPSPPIKGSGAEQGSHTVSGAPLKPSENRNSTRQHVPGGAGMEVGWKAGLSLGKVKGNTRACAQVHTHKHILAVQACPKLSFVLTAMSTRGLEFFKIGSS